MKSIGLPPGLERQMSDIREHVHGVVGPSLSHDGQTAKTAHPLYGSQSGNIVLEGRSAISEDSDMFPMCRGICTRCMRCDGVDGELGPPGIFIRCTQRDGADTTTKESRPPGIFINDGVAHEPVIATSAIDGDRSESPMKIALERPVCGLSVEGIGISNATLIRKSGIDGWTSRIIGEQSFANKYIKVRWVVDAKRLCTTDKQVVSRSFDISPGCSFKLILRPTMTSGKKGQACFGNARGCGSVDLKLMKHTGTAPTLEFSVSIGQGPMCGPVRKHDFHDIISSKGDHKFDFRSTVDQSSTFLVSMKVLSCSTRPAPVAEIWRKPEATIGV